MKMYDDHGDAISIHEAHDSVEVNFYPGRTCEATMFLSPSRARKFAKKIKKAARKAELG